MATDVAALLAVPPCILGRYDLACVPCRQGAEQRRLDVASSSPRVFFDRESTVFMLQFAV